MDQILAIQQQAEAEIAKLRVKAVDELKASIKVKESELKDLLSQLAQLTGKTAPTKDGGKGTRISASEKEAAKQTVIRILKASKGGVKMSALKAEVNCSLPTLRNLLKEAGAKTTGVKAATVYHL